MNTGSSQQWADLNSQNERLFDPRTTPLHGLPVPACVREVPDARASRGGHRGGLRRLRRGRAAAAATH
jgi:hypothetical protein